MNIFDALFQLFARWGINLRYAQLAINATLVGYVILAVLSVFLSSWGLQWVIWIFLAVYVITALNLLFSPFAWGGLAAAAYVRGQVGGQEGFSIEDGFNTVHDWGKKGFDAGAKFLLFYGAVPFIWTALFQTKGWEQENLVALILLPTVIWFALKRWPGSESVRNIIGYVVMAVVVAVIIGTVWNTGENKAVNAEEHAVQKAVVTWFEYRAGEKMPDGSSVGQHLPTVREVVGKLEAGRTLTPGEETAWKTMQKMAGVQEPKKVDVKLAIGQVANGVRNGKVTDVGWLQEHWLAVAIAALGLVIAYRVFSSSSQAVVAEGAGDGHVASARRGQMWWLIIIAVAGWSTYSIMEEVGQPWGWWSKVTFDDHTVPVHIADFQPMVVCGLPAKTKLKADDLGQWAMENTRNGANRMRSGFWYKDATEAFQHASVSLVRVNQTLLSQVFKTDSRGCVTIDIVVSDADRAGAEILGPPVMRDGQWTYGLKKQPFIAMLRFHRP